MATRKGPHAPRQGASTASPQPSHDQLHFIFGRFLIRAAIMREWEILHWLRSKGNMLCCMAPVAAVRAEGSFVVSFRQKKLYTPPRKRCCCIVQTWHVSNLTTTILRINQMISSIKYTKSITAIVNSLLAPETVSSCAKLPFATVTRRDQETSALIGQCTLLPAHVISRKKPFQFVECCHLFFCRKETGHDPSCLKSPPR